MEIDLENRIKALEDIKIFVEEVENENLVIFQSLGWSNDNLRRIYQLSKKVQCSIDSSHFLSEENIKKHHQQCKLHSEGYNKKDILLPDNISSNPITIDPVLRSSIFKEASMNDPNFIYGIQNPLDDKRLTPLSADRIYASFSRDERRAMYDYVVSLAPFQMDGDKSTFTLKNVSQQLDNSKSHIEELAETRDSKRRRTKYKVSTKSKTYTEIIRDVIENQMASYVDIMNERKLNRPSPAELFHNSGDKNSQYSEKEKNLENVESSHTRDNSFIKERHAKQHHESIINYPDNEKYKSQKYYKHNDDVSRKSKNSGEKFKDKKYYDKKKNYRSSHY